MNKPEVKKALDALATCCRKVANDADAMSRQLANGVSDEQLAPFVENLSQSIRVEESTYLQLEQLMFNLTDRFCNA